MTQGLDFLCITETWLRAGESSAFTDLLPDGCCFLNSPRISGRGGGLAVVFKKQYKCKPLPLSTSPSSFELSMFELGRSHTVLCAVVYRPPKYNKNFLNDFSDLLAEIMPKYDHVLIIGDFNIHVCCPDKPMAKDFLNLIDSFDLVQPVFVPTQKYGHTLDLVLTHNLPVSNLEVCDVVWSDHRPVLFEVFLPCTKVNLPPVAARSCRIFNPSSAGQFSIVFNQNGGLPDFICNDTEELSTWFYSVCQTALDSVAPFKLRQVKAKSEPWLNEDTRAARRKCRRAERKWKKDQLQVSYQMLQDYWNSYQKTVKDAKRKHFAAIIQANCRKPHVLFKTIDMVLHAPQTAGVESSQEICENFLHFFIDKVLSVKAQTSQSVLDPSTPDS
ncbi:uncharacterized protein LOC121814858 [Haplochromis burtoni]|uniref:uncharacterized protein LOC121814858 n=1 Tax=Haplochromis burtoni TaxID=8153 RepID=UPI001C2D4E72|nr:uncharacterized protein LOC121814858 [Haplochromis burtoni]